jgi:hypothetical protein
MFLFALLIIGGGIVAMHSVRGACFRGAKADTGSRGSSVTQRFPQGRLLVVLIGIALIVPVVAARLERGGLSAIGIGFLAAGCALIAAGLLGLAMGWRQRGTNMPSGVRAAVMANGLILAFLAVELSDRSVRQEGRLFYWTTFLLLPAMLLYFGLVRARAWSWWVARGAAALGTVWFLAFLVVVPFAPLQANGVPAPWYGRVYAAGVTLAFAAILATAFRSLGRSEARCYFGLVRSGDGSPHA